MQFEVIFNGIFLRAVMQLRRARETALQADGSGAAAAAAGIDDPIGGGMGGAAAAAAAAVAPPPAAAPPAYTDGEAEVVLEVLCDLMAEPMLLPDLLLNYDLDLRRSDVAQPLVAALSVAAQSASSPWARRMCLEVLVVALHVLAARCTDGDDGVLGSEAKSTVAALTSSVVPPMAVAVAAVGGEDPVRQGGGSGVIGGDIGASVGGVSSRSGSGGGSGGGGCDGGALVVETLRAKRLNREGAIRFNVKPRDGLRFLQAHGALPPILTPVSVAHLLRTSPALSKAAIGAYLGEAGQTGPGGGGGGDTSGGGSSGRSSVYEGDTPQFHAAVLEAFVDSFDFSGQPLLTALRMFLAAFRLPGEAQQIDRILQAFAAAAATVCLEGRRGAFGSVDVAYLLSFSVIMLNTDLHNPNIRPEKRMTLEAFLRNNVNYGRDISRGRDLPREVLEDIYVSIRTEQITTVDDGPAAAITVDRWHDLLRQAAADPTYAWMVTHRFGGGGCSPGLWRTRRKGGRRTGSAGPRDCEAAVAADGQGGVASLRRRRFPPAAVAGVAEAIAGRAAAAGEPDGSPRPAGSARHHHRSALPLHRPAAPAAPEAAPRLEGKR
ncbi:unnamed protein product [Phaeothamnion confervicola]